MCDFPPFVLQSNGRTLAVVVDFEVIPNSYPVKAKPKDDYDGEDPLPTVPWLDVQVCNCNCSSYPNRGDVLVNTSATQESHHYTESSDDCQSSEESVSDGNIDLRNEDFMIMMMTVTKVTTCLKNLLNILHSRVAATMRIVKRLCANASSFNLLNNKLN